MARFYAEIKGNRGPTSRMGTPNSGMWAHVRGWNVGVEVHCIVDRDGKDVIVVNKTGGSNHAWPHKNIAIIKEGDE
jgi:hypothetical protein